MSDCPSDRYGRPINELIIAAAAILIFQNRCSTSFVQRKLEIGYNYASKIVGFLEGAGVVSAPNQVGKRGVLASSIQEGLSKIAEAKHRSKGEPL